LLDLIQHPAHGATLPDDAGQPRALALFAAQVYVFDLQSISESLHLVRGGLHPRLAVRQQPHPRGRDPDVGRIERGRAAPADQPVAVAHRADGSGTTYIWVDYLSKVSPEWKSKVGVNTSVKWPTGVGGRGNEGVSGLVRQTPGAIGYVELIYALQNKIAYGSVQNAAGDFVKASVSSVTAAAAQASTQMPADFRVSITNAPGKGVYPISSFTWLLLYEDPKDKAQARAFVDFMKWALTDGQKFASSLGYAPLPEQVVKMEMATLAQIKL